MAASSLGSQKKTSDILETTKLLRTSRWTDTMEDLSVDVSEVEKLLGLLRIDKKSPIASFADDTPEQSGTSESRVDRTDLEMLHWQLVSPNTNPGISRLIRGSTHAYISPLLAFSRWVNIARTDFVRILPAIVLASQLLESDRAMVFWHSLLANEGVTDLHSGHVVFSRMPPHNHCQLPLTDHNTTKAHLHSLTTIALEFGQLEPATVFAYTLSTGIENYDLHSAGHARIILHKRLLDALDDLELMPHTLLRRWFMLAVVLLHELAHAICTAIRGPCGEMSWEDDGFVEMGWAFEKWLFGGRPAIVENVSSLPPASTECTSTETIEILSVLKEEFAPDRRVAAGQELVETLLNASPQRVGVIDDASLEEMFYPFLWAGG
ncbi:hypothetical protein CERZMDRAFT_86221 [Cercospora zeae-maydis SCOH1-5]|uniref:Uncharacterized protein n=1 Tax=Cercospora zeae-maydis SCOH1-5 TaxID=717836 RepID=A0A6A6FAQ0_9PEZI|nr:hypothetical protein CERZMDRAFT_86221 [Cercospora zeae-maydis SCOH1-5]